MLSLIQFCKFRIQVITSIEQYVTTYCTMQYIDILNQLYCIAFQQKILQYDSNISIDCCISNTYLWWISGYLSLNVYAYQLKMYAIYVCICKKWVLTKSCSLEAGA